MGKRTLDRFTSSSGRSRSTTWPKGEALNRPPRRPARIGIYGTSMAATLSPVDPALPGVYAAASASSPVTAWNHYDSIYTERYMWIPQENKTGYEAGSAMTYANQLKGRLMLYYGTADNNVHPRI